MINRWLRNGRFHPTHKELKQQVVVRILVVKADGALFLQMDGVDEGDGAFVSVGHQVGSLGHPRRTAGPARNPKKKERFFFKNPDFRPFCHPTLRPVAAEPGVSAGAVFQCGCQATESSWHGIPLVEADAAAEGVAPRRALRTLLGRHLQELPGLAGERWRTEAEEENTFLFRSKNDYKPAWKTENDHIVHTVAV